MNSRSAALKSESPAVSLRLFHVSVQDYLARELDSPVKHEYVGGRVFAMAEARVLQNVITGNVFGNLYARLKGKRCQQFGSDMKVRIRQSNQTIFYYPDVSVVCRTNPRDDTYRDEPTVIVEVLSQRTRRIDAHEKLDAYLTIPSLSVYLLVEQEEAAVVADRRINEGFVREVYVEDSAVIPLPEIDTELPLAEIYAGVEFTPELCDEEE